MKTKRAVYVGTCFLLATANACSVGHSSRSSLNMRQNSTRFWPIIEEMATLRITEAELPRDIHAVLAKVQDGVEVIVELNHRAVAIIKAPRGPGRKISECIALAKSHEAKMAHAPTPDADFATDVQATIDARREPSNPPAWD